MGNLPLMLLMFSVNQQQKPLLWSIFVWRGQYRGFFSQKIW